MASRPVIDDDYFMDPESLQIDDKQRITIRHGFIRKVYGILMAQILLTTFVGAVFTLSESWRIWIVTSGTWLVTLSMLVALGVMCGLACVPGAAERHPTNIYLLGAFTLAESIGLGAACAIVAATSGASVVLQAYFCTAILVVGLTVFAMQTKHDFTQWNGIMTSCLLALVAFGFLRIFFPNSGFFETVYAVLGALIFSCYIVIDTQMLVGSKKLEVSEDQYVMVALTLYVDIINLFMSLLQLLAQNDEDH